MDTFGKRLRECRKQKNLSQNELASILSTNHSVIGRDFKAKAAYAS